MARKKEYCVHASASTSRGHGPSYTTCFKSKSAAAKFARQARREGETARVQALAGFAFKDLWPFGKKPAKRHPMSRTVYMMKTKSGSYIPVDRPPNATMAGARRRRKRRR